MATTPEGTPYVESSDLVANYPAASLSLANRVDLVGVLPFATSAARATAIPSPTDGQYTYLQDSNSTEFWNGTAWLNAGIPAGLTHINTTTFSAVSSVSINNIFTSAYENYRVIGNLVGTVDYTATMRVRASGTDNTANNYSFGVIFANTTGGTGNASSGVSLVSSWTQNYGGVSRSHFSTDFYSPALTSPTGYFTTSNNNSTGTVGFPGFFGGSTSVTTQYDGFSIISSAGTITGTLRVYGYKNS